VKAALTLGVLAARAALAHADDVNSIHLSERAERAVLPEAVLHSDFVFDPVVQPSGDGLGDSDVHHRRLFELPAGVQLMTDAVERRNTVDLPTRGWRAGAWLHKDLGFAVLSVGGSIENIESRDLRGTYREIGAAITRTFQLANKRVAWLSLSIGQRTWLGDKLPPGEANGFQLMLGFGFTF
jgi:hypothetical protein